MRPRPLDRDREEPGAGVELEELEPGAGEVEELEPGAGGAEEEEEEKPRVGAGVEENPASSSMASTSSIVRSSAIIRFLEIIILAPINYSHVGPSWLVRRNSAIVLEFYNRLTKDLIGH